MLWKKDGANNDDPKEEKLSDLLSKVASSAERAAPPTIGTPANSKIVSPIGANATRATPGILNDLVPVELQDRAMHSFASAAARPAATSSAQKTPTVSASTVAAPGPTNAQPSVQYVDNRDVREVFADCLNAVQFDGHTLRIEFGVTRVKRSESSASQVYERSPSCRLVLTPQAMTELSNAMQQISSGLSKMGPAAVPTKPQK